MKRSVQIGTLLSLLVVAGMAWGQDFTIGFEPDGFQCGAKKTGASGATTQLKLFATVTTANNTTGEGASGFSLSIGTENLKMISATTAGTIVDDLYSGGFNKTEVVNPATVSNPGGTVPGSEIPADQPQGEGATSGVVFALLEKRQLPAEGTQRVLAIVVEGTFPAAGDTAARVLFINGKKGVGQPVNNVITFKGGSRIPARQDCAITLGALQPKFDLRIELEPAGPVRARPGDPVAGTVFAVIDSQTLSEDGAAGWSLSIQNSDNINVTAVTTAGTVVDALYSGGFNKTEKINPATIANPGGTVPGSEVPADTEQGPGVTSGVVLALLEKRQIPGSGPSRVLRISFEKSTPFASEDDPPETGQFTFLNGLKGVGQPVKNVITFKGGSKDPETRTGLEVTFEVIQTPPTASFVRGDPNNDGKNNIADAVWIISELFRGGPKTACKNAGDVNNDGMTDTSDAIFIINYQFLGGPAPEAPFPACGKDPTATSEDCPSGSTSCPD